MNEKYIALTFDDGPDIEITPQVLDILDEYGAKGSFFLIGKNITPETEHLVTREKTEGHCIASHSLTHSDMTTFDAEQIKEEIRITSEKIRRITGDDPEFFRPPYISYNELMFECIPMVFIQGSGCDDWNSEVSSEQRIKVTLSQARNGQIILLHDQQNNHKTVEALKSILPSLLEQGYKPVTLPRLFEACGIIPDKKEHKIYTNVFE